MSLNYDIRLVLFTAAVAQLVERIPSHEEDLGLIPCRERPK